MANPYHVRLAISQYGDQFRAELFTEDLGDTNGDLLPTVWKKIDDSFMTYLALGAAALPLDTARGAGQELFEYLLGQGENAKKWTEILLQAKRQSRPIRLLIDATTDFVRDLPYGLLCDSDDNYYLIRPAKGRTPIQLVRIVRRCTPRTLDLNKPRLKLLLAAAEPHKLPAFDCAARLCELAKGLAESFDVLACLPDGVRSINEVVPGSTEDWCPEHFQPFCHTTRGSLAKALKSEALDILHVLAHGFGNGLVLCDEEGNRDQLSSSELGEWCGSSSLQMAFLQVCKAALVDGRGGFGGLAQQLLNPKYGNLAAVVASAYPVDAERSLPAALSFYSQLAQGAPPDAALDRALDESNWSWAFLELWVRPSALKDTGSRGAFQFASPYLGLSTFEERDAEIFFGREAETAELLKILTTDPVVAVVGDSGSGKSSVLQAGVAYHVRQNGLAGKKGWRIVSLAPGEHPGARLQSRLLHGEQGDTSQLQYTEDAGEALRAVLRQSCSPQQPLLLLFDQFEEMFTLCKDAGEVRAVSEALAEMCQSKPESFRVVLGMRSEFLGQAAALPGLVKLIKRPWVLKPPGAAEVRAIVFEPAHHHGYEFEGALQDGDARHAQSLLDRILQDPLLTAEHGDAEADGDGAACSDRQTAPLPLLEFALERLWLKAVGRGSRMFLHADYDAMGGLAGAIAQHAEEVFVALGSHAELTSDDSDESEPQEKAAKPDLFLICERLWIGLISSRYTRRPRIRGDLETETGHPEIARKLVDYLVGERLLTIQSEGHDLASVRVDISHEVLITRWQRLAGWLSVDAEGRAIKEDFQADAERWNTATAGIARRSSRNLPGRERMNLYLTWDNRVHPPLTANQRAFVEAMHAQERWRKSLMRRGIELVVVVALAMAVLAGWALNAQRRSEIARGAAEQALGMNQLQTGVEGCLAGRMAEGMTWLLRAYLDMPPDGDNRQSACNLMAGWNESMGYSLLHDSPVIELAFSADGQTLVTASLDGKLKIWEKGGKTWETDYRECQREYHHGAKLSTARVGPAGQLVVTCAEDASVYLWNVRSELAEQPKELSGLPGAVTNVAFSEDETTFVTACNNKEYKGHALRWKSDTGTAIGSPMMHDAELLSVAMSPDGQMVLTGAGDGVARLWRFEASGEPLPPTEVKCGASGVVTVSFSPDGKWLAAGTENGRANVWRGADFGGETQAELVTEGMTKAHEDHVHALAFSLPSDSPKLVTCSMDNTARLWDASSRKAVGYPMNHRGPVTFAKFTADGKAFFTASGDGMTRFWDASSAQPLSETEPTQQAHSIITADVDSNRGTLATATSSRVVRLWDLNKRRRYRTVGPINEDAVTALAFNPSSHAEGLVAIANDNGNTMLWDVVRDEPQGVQPPDHKGRVAAVAFDPSGELLATASWDKTARLWNLLRRDLPAQALPHPDKVTSLAFSPDGNTLLTGCLDGNARFWNVASGQEDVPKRFQHSSDSQGILAVAFSPDGSSIATGSADDTTLVWDVATGRQLNDVPFEHDDDVVALAYSPDGTKLLSGSLDGTARLWDVETGRAFWSGDGVRHAGSQVVAVAYSPDGINVATGSWEGTARMWDATTSMSRSRAMWHEPRVYAVAFSPDGKSLLTGSNDSDQHEDGNVRLWPVAPSFDADSSFSQQIRTYLEVRTGRDWIENKSLYTLSYDQWLQRQKLLLDIGVPVTRRGRPAAARKTVPPKAAGSTVP